MKIRGFAATLFTLALASAFQLWKPPTAAAGSSVAYMAQLMTPKAGQVVYPGQQIRIDWVTTYITDREFSACEMKVWLSLDGGRTFPMCITPILSPHSDHFDWTVPNTPTNAAVMDIRFGCEGGGYQESYNPQTASTFVIGSL